MGKKLIVLLAICLCFVSCTATLPEPNQPVQEPNQPVQEPNQPAQEVNQPAQEANQPAQEPITVVVDSLGREVEMPKDINKIAALDPQSATFLVMFGAGERLVAASGGVKRNLLLQELAPNLKSISVPKSSGSLHFEEIARLEPDIILLKREDFTDIVEKDMERLQVPVLVVSVESMQDQIDNVVILKHLLRDEELDKADSFLQFYQETIDIVSVRSAALNEADKVTIFHSVNQAVRTAKYPSLPTDWLAAMGVKNVTIGDDLKGEDSSYYATLEQIFLWDPDVIICNEFDVSNYILTEPKWKGLTAVEKKQVYQIPVGFSRWGHHSGTETPLAMLWLGKTVYPEDYEDIDLYEKTKEFYKDVVGIELSPQLYEKILLGEEIRTAK